jgi:sulfatase modifying factor 1
MRLRIVGLVVSALVLTFGRDMPHVQAVTIDWVDVGDPGNAADDTGYGAVANAFQIAKYEVTIGQYVEFLNAVAKTDTYGLYDPNMASDSNSSYTLTAVGISQSGSPGSYVYTAITPAGTNPTGAASPVNRPIAYVSWFDSARFANWIHNGQPTGPQGPSTTETGAYDLNGATSGNTVPVNPGAQVFLPTADQWYKAAFYKGGGPNAGYWEYAQQSDSIPGNTLGSGSNMANYRLSNSYSVTGGMTLIATQNYLTDVGAFTGSESPYGTFDQGGNLYEWIDLAGVDPGNAGRAGESWRFNFNLAASSTIIQTVNTNALYSYGFRLANPVPEPSAMASLAAGAVSIGGLLRYRRRRASRRP